MDKLEEKIKWLGLYGESVNNIRLSLTSENEILRKQLGLLAVERYVLPARLRAPFEDMDMPIDPDRLWHRIGTTITEEKLSRVSSRNTHESFRRLLYIFLWSLSLLWEKRVGEFGFLPGQQNPFVVIFLFSVNSINVCNHFRMEEAL